ncbi:MAG: PH domain-containing protein [Actinomycetota bacterium]|jgi:membrane protein YdbS with pleckstrin-like domain|nr:PH domain-containing protein [Actinomycetota bacterium]MDA8281327.1 PH domain-containing protein [Actinomycetota bacterium]
MALSRRVLADGEDVVYEARPHWTALGWPLVSVLAVAAALIALAVALPGTPVAVAEGIGVVGVVCALWLVGRLVRWASSTLAVTSLRIVERSGVLSRRGEEIRLDRIAALVYRQSLLGMVVGAGQLHVETGAGTASVLTHVRRPARLQGIVTEQIAAYRHALGLFAPGATLPPGGASSSGEAMAGTWCDTPPAGHAVVPVDASAAGSRGPSSGAASGNPTAPGAAPSGAGARSVADRLATLGDLHRSGLVTDREYATKRAELLAQI